MSCRVSHHDDLNCGEAGSFRLSGVICCRASVRIRCTGLPAMISFLTAFLTEQILPASLIDRPGGGIDRDRPAIGQNRHGLRQTEQGRDAEFPRHGRQMPGLAAALGKYRRRPAQQAAPIPAADSPAPAPPLSETRAFLRRNRPGRPRRRRCRRWRIPPRRESACSPVSAGAAGISVFVRSPSRGWSASACSAGYRACPDGRRTIRYPGAGRNDFPAEGRSPPVF